MSKPKATKGPIDGPQTSVHANVRSIESERLVLEFVYVDHRTHAGKDGNMCGGSPGYNMGGCGPCQVGSAVSLDTRTNILLSKITGFA